MVELRVDGLCINKESKRVVDGASFALGQGELVVLLGPNGAGKSLSLQSALGLEVVASGTARLDGADIHALPARERALKLSYLPQMHRLAWPVRVADLVALGRFSHGGRLGQMSVDDQRAVGAAISACGLTELAERRADTLSGGELARTHCARAFAAETPLIVADEPVAALDPLQQFRVLDLFKDYVAKGGGALIVLHDIALAAEYADRLIWMQGGRIVADGPVKDTLTEALLAEVYGVKARIEGRAVRLIGPV